MSNKVDKSHHLTDSERRSVQQGTLRAATRWLRWIDYVLLIDHIPTRVLKVIDRYGYGGASRKDLRFFTEDSSAPTVDNAIVSLLERKKIKLVKRGGKQNKYIVPANSWKAHPRINEKISV